MLQNLEFFLKVNNEICKTSLKRKKPQEKNFDKFKLFKNFLMSSKKLMSATSSSYSKSTSDYFGTTSMLKTLHTRLRAFVVFASKVWTFICYVFRKQTRAVRIYTNWSLECHFHIFELISIFSWKDSQLFGSFHGLFFKSLAIRVICL